MRARLGISRRYLLVALIVAVLVALTVAAPSGAVPPTARDVLYVGNNWDGTADVIDPQSFKRITRINIIPDKDERMAEIMANPDRLAFFLAIREFVGEGNDQFVDDMFSSHDGRFLYVSRPSFADVVAFNLQTRRIVWRTPVEGYRSDHMAISPDGSRLIVSASTARKAHVIDTQTGSIVGEFESGDSPHENNFSQNGNLIYHASIGTVYTPLDQPAFDTTKGDRWFQIVDANTLQVQQRIDMGQKLEEAGYPDMSSAVRPMALAPPDERYVYFQVSFFHGFVEYDLHPPEGPRDGRVRRLAHLPTTEDTPPNREDYILDSAHHGLSINPQGTKLCAAGTMSNYGAIVDRDDFSYTLAARGQRPYWSTNSGDGNYCFVSFSGDDEVSVISYAEEREVARIKVGDHPQRMRMGRFYR
jgi:DNA-binding beta-propeller fold protein YncE